MSEEKPRVESTKNGPYKVDKLQDFKNSRGEYIEVPPIMFLCRCGGSNNKPFCDGTHVQIGFIDEKEPDCVPVQFTVFL